jgi:glutamate carboxypeptidase
MSDSAPNSADWDARAAARAGAMLDELRDLVLEESPSRNAEAVGRVAGRLARGFAAAGARVELAGGHPNGPNLVARYGGPGRPVLILGHTDTVWALGTLAEMPWDERGGCAYGPGVFDMKAGCVVALEAVRALADAGLTPPVTVLLNCDEEVGSASSRGLIEAESLKSRAVLVLEPSLPGGAAKTSRSGVAAYRLRVRGRAAHAGVEPEKGVNAVVALAGLVLRLHALSDYANGLSVNVGTVAGGTRSNVVPAAALAEVDVRFRTRAQYEAVDAAIRSLAPELEGAGLELAGGLDRPPFERTAATLALYERARAAARASGFELGHGHVGGASDGNFTAALGVPTLDGLGVEGDGAHAAHEHIRVENLPRRAAMLTRLVVDLARDGA